MARLITRKGDLLAAEEAMIVHGCNARGAMRSGVAKAIRGRWPEAYEAYTTEHKARGLSLGDVVFAKTGDGKLIANAITQASYGRNKTRRYVSYDAVEASMSKVAAKAAKLGITAVAMPRIGAGLANGDWRVLECIIRCSIDGSPIEVIVYEL
jgi:O-acetyl-ADP-ribose deacetylase (regulator of RNase III)